MDHQPTQTDHRGRQVSFTDARFLDCPEAVGETVFRLTLFEMAEVGELVQLVPDCPLVAVHF